MKLIISALFALATVAANAQNLIAGYVSDEPGLQKELKGARFEISCDRACAQYNCGEVAKFKIRPLSESGNVITGVTVRVQVDNFGEQVITPSFDAQVNADGVILTEGTLLKPGFLRVKAVMGKDKLRVEKSWSVAYEPEKISSGTPDADDFDEFWADAKRRLEQVPLDMKCTKVEELSKGDKDFYVFNFNTCNGKRLNGSLTVPKKLKPPYPVRIRLPGAGCGVGANRITDLMPFDDALCMMVYPFDWPQAITGSLDKVMAKYDEFWGECVKKYNVPWYCAGISVSREEFFYYPVILGANRAVEWLRSPESGFNVDLDNFVYAGASQGGGLGLALLYLNGNFRKAVIHVTGIADVLGFFDGARFGGWPKIVQAHSAAERSKVADRMRYFDGVNFARRLMLPIYFSAGYADTACPPASVRATFNACASKEKHFRPMIGVGHTVPKDVEKEVEAWLKKR